MTTWHFHKNGQRFEPVSSQQLKKLAASGELAADDLVWKEGMPEWVAAGRIKGLFPMAAPVEGIRAPNPVVNPSAGPNTPQVAAPIPELQVARGISRSGIFLIAAVVLGSVVIISVAAVVFLFSGDESDSPTANSNNMTAADDPAQPNDDGSTASSAQEAINELLNLELPQELAHRTTYDVPLLAFQAKMNERRHESWSKGPFLHYSPTGRFIYTVWLDSEKQSVMLWNASTDSEIEAKAADCDYFSYPACFSEDENSIACVDGDYLRVWNLESSPASLQDSLLITTESKAQEVFWTGLRWFGDTLVLSNRTGFGDRFFQTVKIDDAGITQSVFRGFRTNTGGDRYETFDAVVSPDGQYIVRAARSWDDANFYVLVSDFKTGDNVASMNLRDTGFASQFEPNPLAAAVGSNAPTNTPSFEQPSCMMFSPNLSLLVLATKKRDRAGVRSAVTYSVVRTDSWKVVCEISPPESVSCVQFSPNSQLLCGLLSKSTRTARGEQISKSIVIWDALTGETKHTFGAAERPATSQDGLRVVKSENLRFVGSDDTIALAELMDGGWDNQANESFVNFCFSSWSLEGERKLFATGRAVGNARYSAEALPISPKGSLIHGPRMEVWHVEHLSQLQSEIVLGDQDWRSGNHAEGFAHYSRVLKDGLAWKTEWMVQDDIPRLWSRCIDYFAESNATEKGRALISYAIAIDLAIAPETDEGATLLSAFNDELQQARMVLQNETQQANAERLLAIRQKNQSQSIESESVTKTEFVNSLRKHMARGRIDSSLVYAIFEDYSYQDIFGQPDSDMEWLDHQRLYTYQCRDGAVQLTIGAQEGSIVIVTGLDTL